MSPPVVLLHGLGRTRLAMLPLAYRLRRAGYQAINVGYFGPAGVKACLQQVTRTLERRLAPFAGQPVHFVTHSMGGIMARAYLARHPRERPGRMIQLAPPNQGSSLANAVRRVPLLGLVPALFDLGVDDRGGGLRHELPPLEDYEVGVIAGRTAAMWQRDPLGDGVVLVEETYLPEARDWILLPHVHTLIMNGRDTFAEVCAFLETGRFSPAAVRLERDPQGGVRTRAGALQLPAEPTPAGGPA